MVKASTKNVRFRVNTDEKDLVERDLLLKLMLRTTKRGGVPIRSSFVQRVKENAAPDGSRGALLAKFANDGPGLQGFLLIHAMASSSAPHIVKESAETWAQLSGLLNTNSLASGQQRWSRVVAKLKKLNLISAEPDGRGTKYTLLDESGNGEEYVRPQNFARDGGWISLPHKYWLDGYDQSLTQAAKIMLLIALDQKDKFALVAERVPHWYGVSTSTAQRGFAGLEYAGILSSETGKIFDRTAPRLYRTEKIYTFHKEWAKAARKQTMTRKRVATDIPNASTLESATPEAD